MILQLIVGAVQNGMLGVEMFEAVERIFGHSESAPQENQQCKHHENKKHCHATVPPVSTLQLLTLGSTGHWTSSSKTIPATPFDLNQGPQEA